MPNMYKSFYLQDILAAINETALENMFAPSWANDRDKENTCVSMYNDGIRCMAKAIAERLSEEAVKSE